MAEGLIERLHNIESYPMQHYSLQQTLERIWMIKRNIWDASARVYGERCSGWGDEIYGISQGIGKIVAPMLRLCAILKTRIMAIHN